MSDRRRRVGLPVELLGVRPGVWFPVCDPVPVHWQGRGRWKGGPLHCFVDDYRQEFFWRRPGEGRLVASLAGVVTAPDFSVWRDDPPEWRRYQAWRSAVVAAYWRQVGVRVLPVVSFGSGAHEYVAPGSTWAIRAPRSDEQGVWLWEVQRFCDEAKVGRLVVFGRRFPSLDLGAPCPVEWRVLNPSTRAG